MKVKEIKEKETMRNVYVVTLEPTFIEKLFGIKRVDVEYKDTLERYKYGGGGVYIDRCGERLENGHYIAEAIDRHRRSW